MREPRIQGCLCVLRFVSIGMLPVCAGNEERQAYAAKGGLAHYYNAEKLSDVYKTKTHFFSCLPFYLCRLISTQIRLKQT